MVNTIWMVAMLPPVRGVAGGRRQRRPQAGTWLSRIQLWQGIQDVAVPACDSIIATCSTEGI